MSIYSPYKAVHHPDRIESLREGNQPVPIQVQLIISDLCNHNCSFCAYRLEGYTSNQRFSEIEGGKVNNNPNRMIPYDKCIEILDDCAAMGVKAIQFTGGGEPTVHPRHRDIFQHTLDSGMDLAVITNGTVMRDGVPEILAQAEWVRFSVDAATSETYASMRQVPESMFERTKASIRKVSEIKGRKAELGIGFVVTKENWSEVYDAVKVYSCLDVDNVRISAAFTPEESEYHEPHFAQTKKLIERAREFETDSFRVFDLFGDRVGDLRQKSPDYEFCPMMHLNVYIGGDQTVYTCCNNAYNDIGDMGSLKHQRFVDYWESESTKDKYRRFNPKSCERCMFNQKNRFVNYLLKEPKHGNYI